MRKQPRLGVAADAMIDPGLLRCITSAFDLENLHLGRNVGRDERGWIARDSCGKVAREMTIDSLWLGECRPAFMDPCCLAVIATPHEHRAAFALETHPWVAEYPPGLMPIVPPTMVTIGPLILDQEWVDPVAAALQSLSVPRTEPVISLDGIRYTLYAATYDVTVALEFSNPRMTPLCNVEQGLLQTATALAARDESGTIAGYVEQWAHYIRQ